MNVQDMLQSYGLESEFPETWQDSRYTSALATLDGGSTSGSGAPTNEALVEELLSAITHTPTVAQDEEDPLGAGASIMQIIKSTHGDLTTAQRALYLPSSTNFDARRFLNEVHSQSSLADLERGLEHLKQKMEWNESGLRQMVDTDYENYVATKRKLDDVMDQLHQIGLNKHSEYGFRNLETKIDTATNQLTLCARPMDGFSAEKHRLESALKAIETNRKLLELPETLSKHCKSGEHGEFVREYKRGLRLLDQITSKSAGKQEQMLGARVAERVQQVLNDYRQQVYKQLMNTGADGPYAPLLGKLMDLGVSGNPALEWLNHNVKRFTTELQASLDELKATVERNRSESMESDRKLDLVTYLKQFPSTAVLEASDYLESAEHVDSEEAIGQWEQVLVVFAGLQRVLFRASVFYREFVSLTSPQNTVHKFSRQEVEQMASRCHGLIGDTSSQLVACLAEHLIIPINSNSLAVAKYLGRVLETLSTTNDQISSLFGASGLKNPLSDGLEQAKQIFVESLCECWTRDASLLGTVQDWVSFSNQSSSYSTSPSSFPQFFTLYHMLMIEKLRFILDSSRGGPATAETVSSVTQTFPQALIRSVHSVETALVDSTANGSEAKAQNEARLQPATLSQDSKLLVALNNLETLRDVSLSQVYGQFETVMKQPRHTRAVEHEVNLEVNKIATQLFDIYIRKKKARLSQVLHQEIQRLIPIWRDEDGEHKVTRISNYVYECLMVLVETHALFTESCPPLTRQAILGLYRHLLTNVSEMLRNEVEQLTVYGTMQNIADLEFMRWAMAQLKTETDDLCQRVFDDIKHASTDSELWHHAGGPRHFVRDVLDASINSSKLAFLCFKSLSSV